MSEEHAEQQRAGRPDWPNQQLVRPDGSGPGQPTGSGGSTWPPAGPGTLDAMTKDELLEEAKRRDVTPANASMTKAELQAALEKAEDD